VRPLAKAEGAGGRGSRCRRPPGSLKAGGHAGPWGLWGSLVASFWKPTSWPTLGPLWPCTYALVRNPHSLRTSLFLGPPTHFSEICR
jgi:hypothetical protein